MISINDIAKVKRDARNASSLYTDDEISDILKESNEVHEIAVARIYEALSAAASAKGTLRVGKFSESFERQAESLMGLATWWRKKVVTRKPYAGGISLDDKESRALDTDRNHTTFSKGMNKNVS